LIALLVGVLVLSTPALAQEPPDDPGVPTTPTIEAGDSELTVTWEASGTGEEPILHYVVEYAAGEEAWKAWQPADGPVTATTTTIDGLVNGVVYRVRVIAVTGEGDGEPSQVARATPRSAAPDRTTVSRRPPPPPQSPAPEADSGPVGPPEADPPADGPPATSGGDPPDGPPEGDPPADGPPATSGGDPPDGTPEGEPPADGPPATSGGDPPDGPPEGDPPADGPPATSGGDPPDGPPEGDPPGGDGGSGGGSEGSRGLTIVAADDPPSIGRVPGPASKGKPVGAAGSGGLIVPLRPVSPEPSAHRPDSRQRSSTDGEGPLGQTSGNCEGAPTTSVNR
jgi:hypothetical protein